jgi:hypothetical protein
VRRSMDLLLRLFYPHWLSLWCTPSWRESAAMFVFFEQK